MSASVRSGLFQQYRSETDTGETAHCCAVTWPWSNISTAAGTIVHGAADLLSGPVRAVPQDR
jgi:hypothetical protein